jgi:hypothetical protein
MRAQPTVVSRKEWRDSVDEADGCARDGVWRPMEE